MSFGTYPYTELQQAREKRDAARKQISEGTDPSDTRKEIKADQRLIAENEKLLNSGLPIINSFEHIARDWLASIAHKVRDITHKKKMRRFELHAFPAIGGMAINEIRSPDIFSLIKPIIAKNELETAHRLHSEISAAFSYAIAHGFIDYDPAQAVAAQIPAQNVMTTHGVRTTASTLLNEQGWSADAIERQLCHMPIPA